MHFEEPGIRSIDLKSASAIRDLIVTKLYSGPLPPANLDLLTRLLEGTVSQGTGLSCAQFNELLLLLDQNRINADFYQFFFGWDPLDTMPFDDLAAGITRFRGYAMLAFGNFRYAYQSLRQASRKGIVDVLSPYAMPPAELIERFQKRPAKALEITRIPRDQTWLTGYIAGAKYQSEVERLTLLLNSDGFSDREQGLAVGPDYRAIGSSIKEIERTALENNEIYLTWDYLDAYVATSMRNRWEFEETYDFIDNVFNSGEIARLGLRYFDPTQSLCKNRIDKGLTEALMLKRASCTIYLAQESDTMGKDSELAATLAQGKPVIAYVPKIDVDTRADSLASYPLEFFQQRIPALRAEGLLDDLEIAPALMECDAKYRETVEEFEDNLRQHRQEHPFTLVKGEEDEFKAYNTSFTVICRLIATMEGKSFDRRALLLAERHPLAIQVNLDSGVANGVLVVRNADDCARLLYNLLSNDLSFTIETRDGTTVLVEQISHCPFRVVTENERLSNSFWNFYVGYGPAGRSG